MAPVIELRGVHKFFPGVHALRDVDFEIEAGEVHALVGENGAGKSTLIKIIAGAYTLDEGQLEVEGVSTVLSHPRQAQDLGLVVVHQELELVPSLSVAENIFFGRLPNQNGRVLWKKLHADARLLLDQVGLAVDPKTQVGYLGIAAQQLVEIARALSQQAKLIVMDEPTSALSPQEIDRLLLLVDQLRSRGVSVLYVSHKLEEVLRISNRVTVLRDGAKVACQQTAELDEKRLVALMVGRELGLGFPEANRSAKSVVLQVENLTTDSVNDISFEVREGEIVGFSGLMGAGRTELAQALIGVDRRRGGSVRVGGEELAHSNPQAARRMGLGLVPEDRREQGIFPRRSVRENASIAALEALSRWGWVQRGVEQSRVEASVERLRVRTASTETPIANLSGGNQQKVLLCRWLLVDNLKVLLVDEPTRGIDVGAKDEIYRVLDELAQTGLAIIVFSSEMEEVLGLCDRIYVLREGAINAHYHREEASPEALLESALPN